jgi:hypothetical protein
VGTGHKPGGRNIHGSAWSALCVADSCEPRVAPAIADGPAEPMRQRTRRGQGDRPEQEPVCDVPSPGDPSAWVHAAPKAAYATACRAASPRAQTSTTRVGGVGHAGHQAIISRPAENALEAAHVDGATVRSRNRTRMAALDRAERRRTSPVTLGMPSVPDLRRSQTQDACNCNRTGAEMRLSVTPAGVVFEPTSA